MPICLFVISFKALKLSILPMSQTQKKSKVQLVKLYGCFRKWWYPQIIHLNRVFHYKPSILGTPIFGNTHIFYYTSETWIIRAFPNSLTATTGGLGIFPTHLFLQKHRGANAICVPPGRGSTVDGRSSSRRRRSAEFPAEGRPWWLVAPLGMVTRYPKLFEPPKETPLKREIYPINTHKSQGVYYGFDYEGCGIYHPKG